MTWKQGINADNTYLFFRDNIRADNAIYARSQYEEKQETSTSRRKYLHS